MGTIKNLLRIKPNSNVKLPPKFKAKWIEALTSGKYKQCRGQLVNNNKEYCCMGVAGSICEVGYNKMRNEALLRGLSKESMRRIPKALLNFSISNQLAGFNDGIAVKGKGLYKSQKYNFSQIARWIDKYL